MDKFSLEDELNKRFNYVTVIVDDNNCIKWKVNINGLDCIFEYVIQSNAIKLSTKENDNYAQVEFPLISIIGLIRSNRRLDWVQYMYDMLVKYLYHIVNGTLQKG